MPNRLFILGSPDCADGASETSSAKYFCSMQAPRRAIEACAAIFDQGYAVRVQPYMSPSGCYWRCAISFGNEGATYSSSEKWDIFGLGNCEKMTASEMATLLITKLKIDKDAPRVLWGSVTADAQTLITVDWIYRLLSTDPNGAFSSSSVFCVQKSYLSFKMKRSGQNLVIMADLR